jgi:hypothetical protein
MGTDERLVPDRGGHRVGVGLADVRHEHGLDHRGKLSEDLVELVQPVEGLPAIGVAVGGHQHFRFDLTETVDNSGGAEVGGSGGEHGSDRCRPEHGNHCFWHVRHPGGHPVSRSYPQLFQRRSECGGLDPKFGPGHRPMQTVLSPVLDSG